MAGYVLKRVLQGVPTVLGVTLLTFILLNVFGGNPVVQFLGKHATADDILKMERLYGFDQPLWLQYVDYLGQVVSFDFGRSFVTSEPVARLLWRGLGPSLSLTVPALFFTTVLSVSIALVAAYFRGRPIDRLLVVTAVLGMSVSFLVYIVVGQYLLAFKWPMFHIHGYESGLVQRWPYLVLPILIMVVVGMGYDSRFYRSVVVEEVNKDYVNTARAKGLPFFRILYVHILRNVMVSIVTRVMISVPFLVTGSLLLESFFGIPGLGGMLLDAMEAGDFPVIRAYTVMISVLFVLSNIATDILYVLVDPRVRIS